MAESGPWVYCPHVVESTKQRCGLTESGRGRVTRIPLPFAYLDGEKFVIECPVCSNEILVDTPVPDDEDEDEHQVTAA